MRHVGSKKIQQASGYKDKNKFTDVESKLMVTTGDWEAERVRRGRGLRSTNYYI